jgi:hypothetical protein
VPVAVVGLAGDHGAGAVDDDDHGPHTVAHGFNPLTRPIPPRIAEVGASRSTSLENRRTKAS